MAVDVLSLSDGDAYYFGRLNDEQKKIYAKLRAGVLGCAESIRFPMRPANEISMVFHAMLADNPIVFYANGFNLQTDTYKQRSIVFPNYVYSLGDIATYTDAIHWHLRVFDAVKNKSDREKELFVHDYCSANFAYGETGVDSYKVVGPVLNKVAVCEGIANYVKVALDYLGVSSIVVIGKAQSPVYYDKMENHAWNIVKIGGVFYHLDVTFDMTVKDKLTRYDYFNLCDDDIRKDHVIVNTVPTCGDADRGYYSANGMLAHNRKELESYITRKVASGDKTIVVQLIGADKVKDITDRVMDTATQAYMRVVGSGVSLEVNYNPQQSVFEIHFK